MKEKSQTNTNKHESENNNVSKNDFYSFIINNLIDLENRQEPYYKKGMWDPAKCHILSKYYSTMIYEWFKN